MHRFYTCVKLGIPLRLYLMEKWTNLKSQQQKQGHLIITGEDGCCNRPVNYYMCPQNRRVKWSLPEQGGSLKAGKTASQRRELLSRAVEEGQTFTCQTGKTRHTRPVERPHHCYSESSRSSTQLKLCQEGNRSSCMMGLCGSQSSLDYIPWGLKVWEIWLLGEGNSGHFLENKSSNRGQWRSFVPSTLERGGGLTRAHSLPVRPRYSREVDGQRLSAKVDDKVCCFSPVRRSMTYQMSCFLPGMLVDTLLTSIPNGNKQHHQGSGSNHSRSSLCWETGLISLGC